VRRSFPFFALALFGCSSAPLVDLDASDVVPPPSPALDTGVADPDSGAPVRPDSGLPDARGFRDAEPRDARPRDAEAPDAGPPERCEALGEMGCASRSDCLALRCLDCQGARRFRSCDMVGTASRSCAALDCGCANVASLAECQTAPSCHAVYRRECEGDPSMPLCLMQYAFCGEGRFADCTGPASCLLPPPICESGTSVSYRGSCYEGCVQVCAP
jgi:hypothetical protein